MSNLGDMPYFLAALAGLTLSTGLYNASLFWQRERTLNRFSTILVWFFAFSVCIGLVFRWSATWYFLGMVGLLMALLLHNILGWAMVLTAMHKEPQATTSTQTLSELTHADQPGVIEATEKK